MSKRGGAREQSKQCGASKWLGGASERMSEWPYTLRVDFIVILPSE